MSVLYKGMKMPESCKACLIDGRECQEWQSFYLWKTQRAPNCPLFEVPEHGRLIDADALKEFCLEGISKARNDFIREKDWKFAVRVTEGFCLDIDETPTIIPADEVKEA